MGLNEYYINRLVKLIKEEEEIDLEGYQDVDFWDVFLGVFKKWIVENKKLNLEEYPLSFLLKKYAKEFRNFYKLHNRPEEDEDDYDDEDDDWSFNFRREPKDFGTRLIRKGIAKLPTLKRKESFTQSYGPFLERMKRSFQLPEYANLEFNEPKNYVLDTILNIDFEKMLQTQDDFRPDKYRIKEKMSDYIKSYLGVPTDSPVMGGIMINYPSINYIGQEEWAKKSLVKIKKGIKELPNSSLIHSIRVEYGDGRITLKFIFKSRYYRNWDNFQKLKADIRTNIESLGYAPNKIRVEF